MTSERQLTMADAIAEATCLALEANPNVFVMGVGVDDPTGIFGTTKLPHQRFGDARVFDTPLAENTTTGVAIGAAIMGMRPILVHARCDFLYLTLDQIANHAAKWSYMSGGAMKAPIIIRAVIGRGWGQAAQHSQSLQATIAHIPGINVVMPATARDAKGLLLSALESDHPTVMIEHRWVHGLKDDVPEERYLIPIGEARIDRAGDDLTIVAVSQMVHEARKAADRLASDGIKAEVIDLRSIRPWDDRCVLESVRKTGRLIIADTSWTQFGISAEIASIVNERLFGQLKAPVARLGLPAAPTPCAPELELAYYPNADRLIQLAHKLCERAPGAPATDSEGDPHKKQFAGHF
jgi:pyruvate dehydrogenase E1 component beta subunit